MTAHTGMAEKIVAFVRANPGCSRADLLAGCGMIGANNAMPTYCVKAGLIFSSGPRGMSRYFPDSILALIHHDKLVKAALERRDARKRKEYKLENQRKMAIRKARRAETVAGIKAKAAARNRAKKMLPRDVIIPRNVKITIAKPIPDRWA